MQYRPALDRTGFFGINQELSFRLASGLVEKGKLQPTIRVEAAGGK